MENNLHALKQKLQGLGALRQPAWESVIQQMQVTQLKSGESLVRMEGSIAYVDAGILKEYDASGRKSPSIINFIKPGQPIVTRGHNQHHYLKAISPCQILHWNNEALTALHQQFSELEPIYRSLCSAYDATIDYRQLLLEERSAIRRIQLFIGINRDILPLLKKKDMANYLHLDYDYFVRNFNGLLSLTVLSLLLPC